MSDTAVLESIRALLDAEGVACRHISHEPTLTSQDAARVRCEPLEIGGKALLLKVGEEFRLFVLSAARKLDSAAIKKRFGVRSSRFASREELAELTGLVPGSVPPFGRPLLPFDLFADESVMENPRIAFNAGSLTDSLILATADWERVARPTTFRFSVVG